MSKTLFPFYSPDVSALAKSLCDLQQTRAETKSSPPTHLEMLNLLAKATGARNFQAWRAHTATAAPAPVQAGPAEQPISPQIEKALRVFDEQARMTRWPVARPIQRLCTWYMWSKFEKRRSYGEREVNALLSPWTTFQAHVTMRRELINDGLVTREIDGSNYQRVDCAPPPEARQFLKILSARVQKI
jgi:hypothetical protein